MKIDFTVTKRDKNLLAGLAVCAAVFGFYWFGVKPQMDCLDKLEVQQEELEMQQLQMQVHIAALRWMKNVMRSKKSSWQN